MSTVPILSASIGQPTKVDLRASCQLSIERHVTTLFVECLAIMEQLHAEHWEAMHKLYDALPDSEKVYVDLADHFTDDKRERIRTAILRRGNNAKRAINDELAQYDLSFRTPTP